MSLIENILEEWQYRVDNGMPNPKNANHLYELSVILDEMGLGIIKNKLIENLLKEASEDDKYVSIGFGRYKEKDKKDDPEAPTFEKDEATGKYIMLGKDSNKVDGGEQKPKETPKADSEPEGDDGEQPATDTTQPEQPDTSKIYKSDPVMTARLDKEKEIHQKLAGDGDTDGEFGEEPKELNVDEVSTKNTQSLKGFVERGYSKSQGAPGSPGSMLNEIVSINSATNALNLNQPFDYNAEIEANVQLLKNSGLGAENESTTPSGKRTSTEARELAKKHDISIGLASKIVIATKAAQNKHNRIQKDIIQRNGLDNFTTIPLFGDGSGLERQKEIVNGIKGTIKLGNTDISKQEALKIIADSGGGENPSDTAIFVVDKNTGDLYMSFFSDKDGTNAIVAQSSVKAENEVKKRSIDDLVMKGKLKPEEAKNIKEIIDTKISDHERLEQQLNDVVSGPGKHLETVNVGELTNLAKTLSKGAFPDKYWKANIVKKFAANKKWGNKKSWDYLPINHSEPPTDEEMMKGFINYANDAQNQGLLSKDEQRIITDLSNATNGPKLGAQIGEIRKKTVQTDLNLINELDNFKITLDNGSEVGLGTMLEAQSVAEKLHLDMLFGGEGVYKDETAFCQESGGVTVDKAAMAKCLPYESREDVFSHFEIGEERETVQKGSEIITGGSRIVYAITKEGNRYAIGEKKQRSKTGPLGRLQTVYNFHPDLQKCFDGNGK